MPAEPYRILSLTTLFPHGGAPSHGIFVETRLRQLVATGRARVSVVAPVPWVPGPLAGLARYRDHAGAPPLEQRFGIPVAHPRYAVLPKIGMTLAPLALARAFRLGMAQLGLRPADIDIVDAHYFYPDGVAAALVARALGKPLLITGRGTDLNLIPAHALPRRLIRWAATQAHGIVTVCDALQEPLRRLGVDMAKVRTLRNGVDLAHFAPQDRFDARKRWGVTGPTLLSVGHLVERKGHDLVIRALLGLPGVSLLVAGEGEERPALERLARRLGLGDRVRLLGRVGAADLPSLYAAADALVLASSREGWANVLLEAMACGTPVVATPVWGTPEVVAHPAAGLLTRERSAEAIAAAARTLLAAPPDRAATRAYAEGFSWDATVAGLLDLMGSVIPAPAAAPATNPAAPRREIQAA